jgi:hypothetical protein
MGSSGLGIVLVSGLSRVPSPAAKIMAFTRPVLSRSFRMLSEPDGRQISDPRTQSLYCSSGTYRVISLRSVNSSEYL